MVKTNNKSIEKAIEKAKKDRKKLLYSQIDFWLNAKEHTEGFTACGKNAPAPAVEQPKIELSTCEQARLDKKRQVETKYGDGYWAEGENCVDQCQTYIVIKDGTQTEFDYDLDSGFIMTTRFTWVG